MTDINEIARIIQPSLTAMGYRLVRIVMIGRATLQVMAEHADDTPMAVDDCADISRAISALLDVADPIAGAYRLEVSSPGLDRPLVRPEDYERFAGYEAKLELNAAIGGRKRFRGRLIGRSGESVRVATDAGELDLPLAAIARAKLVVTDDLLAAHQNRPAQIH